MTRLSERLLRTASRKAPELASTSPTLSAAGAGVAYLGYRAKQ
ncbi:hypothetical protein ACFPYI_10180 [Halomarina salina]|uniref:Uncharacterized protein n=1 Tax=Halomarina salina TaxID=1872699 RepID=A0ABD5RN06_9EURY|nr:hypothetical protein [Halomarina salina]